MNDPWMEHLKKFDLFELHQEAQKVGYRVRVANGAIFDLEYEGGFKACYEPERGLRRFNDTDKGRQEARGFLIAMKQLMEEKYWGIVSMYTEAFLQASGKAQSLSIICAHCGCNCEFRGMEVKEAIELALHFGYRIINDQPVCDKCIEFERRSIAIYENGVTVDHRPWERP